LTLNDLISSRLEDFHLLHVDEEHDLATIVELYPDTLTAQGRIDWADVLNANVERIYNGYYGIQADISGCEAKRLCDFSYMLAGQVPLSDYNRWVNDGDELETVVTPQKDVFPTTQATNGEIRVEDWVIVVPDEDEYGCLVGMVTAIDKKGTPEHGTDNVGDDIHVDFTVVDYPPDRTAEIEKDFSESYGEPKVFDELPLDDVIMASDMLIRITGIHFDDLSHLVNNYEAAEAYCNEFSEDGVSNRQKAIMLDELTARVEKNYADYLKSLEGFGTSELIDMASKIHAVSDAYSSMTAWHEFDAHELGFFLQFQNPLEVVADEWRDRNIDVGDVSDVIEHLYGNSDDLLEAYPLMCDATEPVSKLPEQTSEKPKKSLEEKMKAAQKKADEHNASKSDNKKSAKKERA